jgi:integration host factor subunit beta
MTKSQLIEAVAERADWPKKQSEAIVNAFFEAMRQAILSEERIEVRGFGSFSIREYDARKGRNPRTGEEVFVEAKKSVHFKVGKELRERVDTLNDHDED